MSKVHRSNRKATDDDIVRLNSIGLSLRKIGEMLGCHQTTVIIRLKALGIEAADTRRCFMEDVLSGFTESQLEKLADRLGPQLPIRTYVRNLVAKDLI